MDHLGSYIFHGPAAPSLDQHIVLGWSLGGHAAWQVLFNEPRVTAAVVVVGCPDYMSRYISIYLSDIVRDRVIKALSFVFKYPKIPNKKQES